MAQLQVLLFYDCVFCKTGTYHSHLQKPCKSNQKPALQSPHTAVLDVLLCNPALVLGMSGTLFLLNASLYSEVAVSCIRCF